MHRSKRRITPGRVVSALALLLVLGAVGTCAALYAQGYRMYVVHTGSMSPTYKPGDVVIDRPAGGSYAVGDVITFFRSESNRSAVTTHRVVEVTPEGLHTKGDANETDDTWTTPTDYVVGKVVMGVPMLGYLMVYLQQGPGIASLTTTTLAVILLWGMFFPGAESSATKQSERDDPEPDTPDDGAPTAASEPRRRGGRGSRHRDCARHTPPEPSVEASAGRTARTTLLCEVSLDDLLQPNRSPPD